MNIDTSKPATKSDFALFLKLIFVFITATAVTAGLSLGLLAVYGNSDSDTYQIVLLSVVLLVSAFYTLRSLWYLAIYVGCFLFVPFSNWGWPITIISCFFLPVLIPLLIIGAYYTAKLEDARMQVFFDEVKELGEKYRESQCSKN